MIWLDWVSRVVSLLFLICLSWVGFGYCGMAFVFRWLKRRKSEKFEQDNTVFPANDRSQSQFLIPSIKIIVEGWARYSLMFTGKIPSHVIRNFLYRNVYQLNLHHRAVLYGGSEIRSPHNIEIHEGAIVGDLSILDGRNGIIIGKHANLSTGVWIWTLQHDMQCPDFSCRGGAGQVIIGERAWLSCRVTVLPGVSIGAGAVVAAGSVVTKDLEPYSINAGIPARKIGERNRDLRYEFDGVHIPFF